MTKNENVRNVPELRFRGFTDAWEKRRLEDLAVGFEYGLNAAATEFDGIHQYLRITDIDDATHEFMKNNITSPNANFDEVNDYLLHEGDIVFARTGASTGKTYRYKDSDGLTYFAGFLIRIKVKVGIDGAFVYQSTLLNEYNRYIKVASQRSGQLGVNSKEYAKYQLFVPQTNEQHQIGLFLSKIDDTVALHQRKHDLLLKLKKGYLQKLFPQNGEVEPELRFSGFTDAWEKRKLGKISSSYSGGTPSASNKTYYGGKIPFIRSAEINENTTELFLTAEGLTNSSAKMVTKGTLLYALYGATSGEVGISSINGAINQAILAIIPNGSVLAEFLAQWLKLQKSQIIEKYLQGGQGNLSASIVNKLAIEIPSLTEQKKITDTLFNLDATIALHQRKLDELKKLKKAYLQKMFV
ncbi:MAG: restriction endonuclease subunit S [Lacticaseibacillus songhuajiangensis]|jgi:type I restriction enzyme S subunit|nr:restriction endonuclease subunit S [Lacticaseibacillus songhuajiangensis]